MATGAASPVAGRQGRFNSTHSSVVNMDVAAADAEDEAMSAAKAAKHRHNRMAYWIMTLLGAGMLFPWNAVVNAVGYFNHLYPGRQFEFYVALAYISPQLIVVAAMVKWGDRISFTLRIVSMFLFQAATLILIPVISSIVDEDVSFWANLLWVFLIGVSTSILQPSVFGFSSQLPEIFNQAIMAGQGVAGAGVSFMRLATKGFVPDPRSSALLFFSISCFVMVVCVFAYYVLLKMEFTQYHLERSITTRRQTEASRIARTNASNRSNDSPVGSERDENGDLLPPLPSSASRGTSGNSATRAAGARNATPTKKLKRHFTLKLFLSERLGLRRRDKDPSKVGLLDEDSDDEFGDPAPGTMAHFCYLTTKMWRYAMGVLLVFVITFSVFPGEITSIKYEGTYSGLDFLSGSWWPIVLVTVFNCFDLTGRTIAGFTGHLIGGRAVFIVSILRLGFVPLFILNVHNPDVHVFSDLFCLIMVACYAITNGLFASIAMMKGPSAVPPHEREAAGFFMTLFLQAGIFLGAFVALGVKALNAAV